MKQEMRELILQQVKEGKMTIEEAMTQLERLERLEPEQVQALEERQDTEKVDAYSVESLTTKLTSAVEGLVTKLRDSDFSFSSNFGPEVTYSKSFPFTGSDISLDLFNASATIVSSDAEDCELIVTGRPLRQQDADKALEQLQSAVKHSVIGDRLVVSLRDKLVRAHVELYVPHHHFNHLLVQTLNGEVRADGLDVENVRVQTANGRVVLHDVHASELLLNTGNGTVEVEGVEAELVHVRTGNGAVIVGGKYDKASLKTGNGNIRAELATARPAKFELASLAGNIRLVLPHGVEVEGELETNFGGLHCLLDELEIIRDRKDVAQRRLEFLSGRGQTPRIEVEAGTRTGTIDLEHGSVYTPSTFLDEDKVEPADPVDPVDPGDLNNPFHQQ
ncbi:DUF4097 domain-containing protein [Exiguobacterium profundum]|uniref:DUF4097 domain-containing protein n=1 Tax=Exiguobacterium sp. (strain ATCC BAA-1283 / AT1b) TaxID=360911 RepID=C4L5J7_EXISA|nr:MULTISPECIES: DUF4097 family beta strand repeat-containing protein [Exiguobacterium]MBG0917641.1 DUF4097 domain-containing protein [Exiguobacterium sp. SRB7LM]QPI68512.1 DUF4097 family beta strand repeat protein [Exiguobacterium sp. PBE]ACQ69812.1 hypothetical protein EAT1b_0883 [Exiguobacterium sp. AT1b]MCT4798044.1 DUF4097 family beta strand repeat-containing protein [Exiguobacterium profundum]MDT0192183.1 DUF4097 family beta strand repeat-containing protein [Exiguobacterium sp. BG5(2022)